ncbi:hypothetical protein QTP88_013178 [Uroleucon formosanum]
MNFTIDKILSFSNNNTHNHEQTTDHNLVIQCVRTAVKRNAEEDLHARTNKIIRKEIQDTNLVFKEIMIATIIGNTVVHTHYSLVASCTLLRAVHIEEVGNGFIFPRAPLWKISRGLLKTPDWLMI